MQNERERAERELAERVRAALIECALEAYADAGVRGLCAEGAWEATVVALRRFDLGALCSAAECSAAEPDDRAR